VNLLLDSSFVIDHLAGDAGARARWDRTFESGDRPFVTEIVVCEVRAGLRDPDEKHLAALLLAIEFVQPGPAAAMQAGRWGYEAHRRGRHLSLADGLIAAAAEALNAAVLTRNVRDFALTPVRVESY
jgi:predicted nucleic acid-binding protein